MKIFIPVAAAIVLSACSQVNVTELDVVNGIVHLNHATDDYVANNTATELCQQMGYTTAAAFGQPVKTCTATSGSRCMNKSVALQYQCHSVGIASSQNIDDWQTVLSEIVRQYK